MWRWAVVHSRVGAPQRPMLALPPHARPCGTLPQPTPQSLPPELGKLQRLKLLQLDGNAIAAVPPPILRDCAGLATLSLHDNPITPGALQATDGYAAFEARRQGKVTKSLATGAHAGECRGKASSR